jgi:putative ABC transport system permease protein
VTVALQSLSAMVAALAIALVLSALIHERARELAIVRVLGGSRAQLAGIVLWEALLLGLAGAFGGLAIGLVVGYVLVAVLNPQSFGWSLTFAPPASVLLACGAVLPACLVAGLVPMLRALRAAPREALRELA